MKLLQLIAEIDGRAALDSALVTAATMNRSSLSHRITTATIFSDDLGTRW